MTARPTITCARCHRDVPRRGVSWPEGFVCNRCYQQATRRRGTCPGCHQERLLPGLLTIGTDTARPACADCAHIPKDFHCTRCTQEDEPHRTGLCARCCLTDDLTTLLADPTGTIPARIRPLTDALISQDRPRSAMIWLRNPDVRRLLVGLADATLPLTHDTFDAEANQRTAMHLRELCTRYDLLPSSNRTLLQLQHWLDRTLPSYSPTSAALLRSFATWHHLRQMRALADAGTLKPSRGLNARQEISVAATLLAHLEDLGVAPTHVRQAHLDAWLAAGPTTRYTARTFVIWASKNNHLPALTFPHRTARTTPVLTQDERLALLRQCLTADDPRTLATRLAAVLLLLYAQPVTRIARLKLSDITDDDTGLSIRLGHDPALIPEPVELLLRRHLSNRRNTSTAANTGSTWLFPGQRPDQPLHHTYLMNRIRQAGIDLSAARNSALRQLVLDMPPAIVARTLGYSPAVTDHHAQQAAAPYASYAHRE